METFYASLAIVRGIHRSPMNFPHKRQWRRALVFSLICARINGWVNNREVGDLRRHRAHYDVIVMSWLALWWHSKHGQWLSELHYREISVWNSIPFQNQIVVIAIAIFICQNHHLTGRDITMIHTVIFIINAGIYQNFYVILPDMNFIVVAVNIDGMTLSSLMRELTIIDKQCEYDLTRLTHMNNVNIACVVCVQIYQSVQKALFKCVWICPLGIILSASICREVSSIWHWKSTGISHRYVSTIAIF